MANIDNPRGFWPLRHLSGGEIRTNRYTAAGTIYRGDLVTAGAGGTITASAADAGVLVIGVAAHYGLTTETIEVYDDPNIVFGVQADTGTAPAATDIFATANHVAGSGNTTTKISGHELDSSDIGTGLQMRIIGKVEAPDNDWGEHVDVAVVLVEHALRNAASI